MASSRELSSLFEVLNDPKRLDVLDHTGLLDTPPEEAFDRLTRLASEILDAPVALVSLVGNDRQFFKSQIGLPEPWGSQRQTALTHSFCQHVVASASPLVVADAREHPLLRNNEAIRDLKVIAYLGVPLTTPEGQTLGSFCTIDGQPRVWKEREIKIMQDLATFVMTEVELRLLARHFHANFLRLRNLELEREELVQMLVHDLRNPLSSLLLGLDLMEMSETPQEAKQCLNAAKTGAQSLLQMVNEILEVSKSQAGRLSLQVSEVSAGDILKTACDSIAELATQAGVSLGVTIDPDVPSFQADQEKLRRILVNLISNAVQHTPQNGKINIFVWRNRNTKRIIFEVADTGMGIPRESFCRIFEKYQTKPLKDGKVSTGLGLPFCKMAVEAHGGEISVESELGKGTTFRVEIPETQPGPLATAA